MPAPKGHPPYPGCETGGRPVEWTDDKLDQLANDLEAWIDEDNLNILIEDFASRRRINEKYFYDLMKRNKKLSNAYSRLKTRQKAEAIKGALTKQYNHATMVWMMAVNHGIQAPKEDVNVSSQSMQDIAKMLKDSQPMPKQ
jgi:hypothetical protein